MRFIFVPIILLVFAARACAETITISAAISLKESLSDIQKDYEARTHDKLVFNFDASGKLAAQIDLGAPVDLFISADEAQMDKLAKSSRILPDTRRVLVHNTLVLITAPDEKHPPKDFADLAVDHGKKIAVGEPKTVPAGRYAVQTFKSLHIDSAVASRLVYGESVRQVLSYVEQDSVCAGIVYSTDAKEAGDKVKLIATADASSHDLIEYPGAVVAGASHAAAAKKFLDYLSTEPAQKVFLNRGFSLPAVKAAK